MDQALRVSIRHERAEKALRVLTLSTPMVLFGLITLGGVVRVTDSGLGCPDWPFCHGRIIPSSDAATLIEYSHRLLATIAGLMVFGTALVVWKAYRTEQWLLGLLLTSVVLLVAQVLLGWATVDTELEPGLVMAHLALAEVLLACMIVAAVAAWRGPLSSQRTNDGGPRRTRKPILMPVAVVGTYILLLAGSYVQASEATGACGDSWPLCQGELFPGGELPLIHMVHRFLAILVGGILVASLVEVWRSSERQRWLQMATLGVAGLFLVQVLVGGLNVWLGFPLAVNVLHMALATGVWASLVALAALCYPLPSAQRERSYGT